MRALHALHSFRPAAAIIVRRPCVTQRFTQHQKDKADGPGWSRRSGEHV